MKAVSHKFETQVHLGLSVIILVLLALNAVSNAVLYSVKNTERELLLGRLQSAALAASRTFQQQGPTATGETVFAAMGHQYELSELVILPALPARRSPLEMGPWLVAAFPKLPAEDRPGLISVLLEADYRKLYRLSGDQYLVATQVPLKPMNRLLVVIAAAPDLSHLERAGDFIFWASLGAIFVIAVAYVFLSRRIIRPYQRWREVATEAGRTISGQAEPEMMADDYRAIIEDLKESEVELRRLNTLVQQRADSLEQFNAHLLASMSAGLVTFDTAGVVRTVNRTAAQLLDLDDAGAEGQPIQQLLAGSDMLIEIVRGVVEQNARGGYREVGCRIRGRVRTFGVLLSPIQDLDKRIIGHSLLINDLTELARLRAELEQAKRLSVLGEMAAGLAHQIRNALGAINGFATLVRRRLIAAAQPTEHVEALLKESRQSEALLGRFLDFARPLHLQPIPTDLEALIESAVVSARSRYHESRVNLVSHCRVVEPVVLDPLLMVQAIGNLIDNAFTAIGRSEGQIEVRAWVDNTDLSIEIADDGPGIDPELQARIFAPFVSTRPSGTGLGLPLVARIAELHGGAVSLHSESGKGAVFQIRLPILSAGSAGQVAEASSANSQSAFESVRPE